MASTVYSYLWLKSRYVPRALAAFGLIGSGWCVACTLLLYVFPNFPKVVNLWWFDTPMALFEIGLGILAAGKGTGRGGFCEQGAGSVGRFLLQTSQ